MLPPPSSSWHTEILFERDTFVVSDNRRVQQLIILHLCHGAVPAVRGRCYKGGVVVVREPNSRHSVRVLVVDVLHAAKAKPVLLGRRLESVLSVDSI